MFLKNLSAISFLDKFNFFKIQKATIFALIVLCLFSILLPLCINYSGYKGMEEYLYHVNVAKGLFRGENYFSNNVYGPVYPYILSFFFMLSGNDAPFLVELMDLIFLSLTVVTVFLITKFVCNDDKVAVFSSIIFIFITHFTIFLNISRELVDFSNFFISITLLAFLLSYKFNSKKAYLFSLMALLITGLVKYEFMILSYLFVIGLILYKRLNRSVDQIKKLLIPFLVFLGAFYIAHFFASSTVSFLDPYRLIFWIKGPFFNTDLLFKCSLERLVFLTSILTVFLPLFFIGTLHGLRRYKKETLFFLFSFVLLNLPYLICVTCHFQRYLLYTLIPFAVLCSLFFDLIIKMKIDRRYLAIILIITMLLLSIAYANLLYNLHKPRKSPFFEKNYSNISFLSNGDFNKTFFMVPLRNEKEIFRYWLMREVLSVEEISQNVGANSKLILPTHEYTYFIETSSCKSYRELCDRIIKNYNIETVYANEDVNVYRVYV